MQRISREERDKDRTRRANRKDPEAPVDQVELTDAVRSLKDNTQEEAQDDRQERPQYGAGGRLVQHREGSLDLQG
ncbi:MAG: hypothetical protein IPJ41_08665 [Phycisphaerales bacterium]|nr:hypothetical protein [Phycisphaerales bacterium]